MHEARLIPILALAATATFVSAQEPTVVVRADRVLHRATSYLTGACLEDVNHEIYGGIDSQMIFGESFAEPAPQRPLKGFDVFGGRWTPEAGGSVRVVGSDGAKIVWNGPEMSEGEASVDVWLTEAGGGNGGLILKVSDPDVGADRFNGYEVALERPGTLVLGRHRQNWEPLQRVPCPVPVNEWITLTVHTAPGRLEVLVNGQHITTYRDSSETLERGRVGLRSWQHAVRFRNLRVATSDSQHLVPFERPAPTELRDDVSGMWDAIRLGTATGSFALETRSAFSGRQSQRITHSGGAGVVGIENRGLNRWGMNLVKGQPYEGYVHVRADQPTGFAVALQNVDGSRSYAERRLKVSGNGWERLDFTLEPRETDRAGRFAILLDQPGSLSVGYAFLHPGDWGRFRGLPVRKDVATALIDQGITLLRLGGCMANADGYRWKNMTGPRAHRPPYEGWWYPHASNGWGIFEFLDFCAAAGFLAVPDLNCHETPEDVADFVEYANGPADSGWGRVRAANGHPDPYAVKYLQFGNEEQINETYWNRFKPVAEAVWAKDPDIILIVGDFAYRQAIRDPFSFSGADGRITSLATHRKILQLAKQHDREVWFDVHIWTGGPEPASSLDGMFSYADALERISEGADHRVVVFELNADNPAQRRALANALALNAILRDGRVPMVASANCLQPDGQNDNGWDQGLLFLNPTHVWLQPPGHVTRMVSKHLQALVVECTVRPPDSHSLDVGATISEDGRTLVLQVVNAGDHPITAGLDISGFIPTRPVATVRTLAGPLDGRNTASNPNSVTPSLAEWQHGLQSGHSTRTFPAHSFTVIAF